MTTVARQNTFKNIFNLYDYDVGPTYLGDETVRGLRNLRGECLPILNRYGKVICCFSWHSWMRFSCLALVSGLMNVLKHKSVARTYKILLQIDLIALLLF